MNTVQEQLEQAEQRCHSIQQKLELAKILSITQPHNQEVKDTILECEVALENIQAQLQPYRQL